MYVSCVLDVNVFLKDVVQSHFFNRLQYVCLLFFFKSNNLFNVDYNANTL